MGVMLQLFEEYPAEHKWLVLGQMLEQGEEGRKEHERLAEMVLGMTTVERVIVIGEMNGKWLVPYLSRHGLDGVEFFEQPAVALNYIKEQLQGGEVLLLKGAPFMEAMVEGLLANPADEQLLVRREEIYRKRREKFYGKEVD
jgi:UDP-N-acetylmuramoyl-tripeptide--D-alanyl-D-alanine ligase